MGLRAELLGRSDWSSLLGEFPTRSVFHTLEWLDAIQKVTGFDPLRIGVFDKEGPVLLLPLFERRVAGVRSLLSPPPGLGVEFMGPLYRFPPSGKRDKVEILAYEATEAAVSLCEEKRNPSLIFIKCGPSVQDIRPWAWLGFEPKPLYTYEIDLSQGLDEVLASFKRELRNDLARTANRVTILDGGVEALDVIHGFVDSRFREQELSFEVPLGYIRSLFAHLSPRNIQAFVAQVGDKAVGGLVATLYNRRAVAWIGARSRERIQAPITDLLFWHTIRWGLENGADVFELMGANVPRLRAFKAKYNADLVLFFQLEKSRLMGRLLSGTYRRLKRRHSGKGK